MKEKKSLVWSIFTIILSVVLFLVFFKSIKLYKGPNITKEDVYISKKNHREKLEKELDNITEEAYIKEEKEGINKELDKQKSDLESDILELESKIDKLEAKIKEYK